MGYAFYCSKCKLTHEGECPPLQWVATPLGPISVTDAVEQMSIEELKAHYLWVKNYLIKRMPP